MAGGGGAHVFLLLALLCSAARSYDDDVLTMEGTSGQVFTVMAPDSGSPVLRSSASSTSHEKHESGEESQASFDGYPSGFTRGLENVQFQQPLKEDEGGFYQGPPQWSPRQRKSTEHDGRPPSKGGGFQSPLNYGHVPHIHQHQDAPGSSSEQSDDVSSAQEAHPFPLTFPLSFFSPPLFHHRPLTGSSSSTRPRRPSAPAKNIMGSGNFGVLRGGIFPDHDRHGSASSSSSSSAGGHDFDPFHGDNFFRNFHNDFRPFDRDNVNNALSSHAHTQFSFSPSSSNQKRQHA